MKIRMLSRLAAALTSLAVLAAFAACGAMPGTKPAGKTEPTPVIIDTDIGNSTDDLFALEIIVIGFVSSLVQLMESGPDQYSRLNGVELIKKKVDSFYFMGTKLGFSDDPGYNLRYDIPLATRFLEEWPKEVPARYLEKVRP